MPGDIKLQTENGAVVTTVVAVNNLTKKFNEPDGSKEFIVLDAISLNVDEGKFASIVGPSGCGKSTLLNIIAGIETHVCVSQTVHDFRVTPTNGNGDVVAILLKAGGSGTVLGGN